MEDKTLKLAPVVYFNGVTRLDLDSKRVLQQALDADLQSAIVIGYDQDGELWFSSTKADGPNVLWDLEKAKNMLLNIQAPE